MSEFAELDAMISEHRAWKNSFFDGAEKITFDQLKRIVPEYYYATEHFPSILARLIARVDPATRFYLTNILYSELGSGIESQGHAGLFRTLCHAIGVSDQDMAGAPRRAETRALVEGLRELYGNAPIQSSLGGQYALEFQADNMLHSFRKVFSVLERDGRAPNMEFFTIHDQEEPEHVLAMKQALERYTKKGADARLIMDGAKRCLDLFGDFWSGMDKSIAA